MDTAPLVWSIAGMLGFLLVLVAAGARRGRNEALAAGRTD
jgi:hypothetical protein